MGSRAEMGETDRPARISPRPVRGEATQPCDSSQTARVEVATQPRDGCAAGMLNGRGAGRTPTRDLRTRYGASRLPNRHRGSSARPLDRLTQREGAYPLWNAVGRAGLDPSGNSGSGMDPPGFSARNAGKSQKLRQLSPRRRPDGKGSGASPPTSLPPMGLAWARAQLRHNPKVKMRRSHRRSSARSRSTSSRLRS